MATPKSNCLWCAWCTQYDEGLFHCSEHGRCLTYGEARARRKCGEYRASWCRADDLEGADVSDSAEAERERALYEKRMRGDWT